MTVTAWNQVVIDGKNFLVVDVAKFRIPLEWDPSSNMFIAVAAPDGGLGNFPALVQGDDGATPEIDTSINLTALEHDDPTVESASWTETSPNVYKLNLSLRNGAPGDETTATLDPDDYGTPVAGRLLRVKSDLSGFEYTPPPVGDSFLPATIAAAPSGNAAYTLCTIGIDAQPFDYRLEVEGQTVVTGTGADVAVNLVARLGTTGVSLPETTGNFIAKGFGIPGAGPQSLIFSAGSPAGSSGTYNKVLAGNTATAYIRVERRAGTETFTTSADTSIFRARVCPIP